MQPFTLAYTVPCTTTSDPSIGSKCSRVIAYIEAILGAQFRDGARTQWEVGQVQVWDGGADADGATAGDNARFAVQGVFIP